MTQQHLQISPRAMRLAGIAGLIAVTGVLSVTPVLAQSAAQLAFRNAVKGPPPGWTGPVFQMSRNYPASLPRNCPECTWLTLDVDFKPKFPPPPNSSDYWVSGKWADYIKLILDYVKEGQDPQFGNTPGFRVNVGGKTRWFNVPWMAYDPTFGREFVHGTTNRHHRHRPSLCGSGQGYA